MLFGLFANWIGTTIATIMTTMYRTVRAQQIPQFLLPLRLCDADCVARRPKKKPLPRQSIIHVGGSHKTSIHQNRAGYNTIIPKAIRTMNDSCVPLTAGGKVAVGGV